MGERASQRLWGPRFGCPGGLEADPGHRGCCSPLWGKFTFAGVFFRKYLGWEGVYCRGWPRHSLHPHFLLPFFLHSVPKNHHRAGRQGCLPARAAVCESFGLGAGGWMLTGRNEPQVGCPGEKAAGAYACNYGAGKAPSRNLSQFPSKLFI